MMDRRTLIAGAGAMAAAAGLSRLPVALAGAGAGPLRVASLKFGSLSWLLDVMRTDALDAANGFKLETVEVASNHAGPVALLAGEADIIVSDWTWAMRQRGLGDKLKFAPYSSALGSVMVPAASPIRTLADLKGKKIGVAGTAIDKSWLLLRAYAKQSLGTDLAELVTPVFGAAPLMTEELKNGRLDAALNFWTFAARLKGAGYRQVLSMADVLKGLAIAPTPALVGFIWKEDTAARKPVEVAGFLKAAAAANARLAKEDAVWDRIRPLVKPENDAEFTAIREYYRAGIPGPWTAAETAAAGKLTELLIALGSKDVMGSGTRFDGDLFHSSAS